MNKKKFLFSAILILVGLILILSGCRKNEEAPSQAAGQLLNYGDCKSSVAGSQASAAEDCLEYHYDGATLCLKHVNAGFNCCPGTIHAAICIESRTIAISEREDQAGCLCNCLFDIDYLIENLAPGEYTIQVDEPYLPAGDAPLAFTVQLTPGASGIFCVPRSKYPWGIPINFESGATATTQSPG